MKNHFRDECKEQTQGFSGAAFKKFNSEAECNRFIAEKSVAAVLTSTIIPTTVRTLAPALSSHDLPFTSKPPVAAPTAPVPVWVPPSVVRATPSTSGHCSSCSCGNNPSPTPPAPKGPVSRRTTKYTPAQRVPPVLKQQMHTYLKDLGQCLKRKSSDRIDTRPIKLGRFEYETDELGYVHVFTDGSCVNNGKKDARAGLGVYFGEGHPL